MKSRTGYTLLGLALIAVGVYAFLQIPGRSEWVALAFVGIGGFLVSKSQTLEILKAAGDFLVRLKGGDA